jgi:SPP1 gp7 family putative phage head morphogenesis protein
MGIAMLSLPLPSSHGARLLLQAWQNVRLAAHPRETAIHKVADAHIAPIQQVVSAAFAKGRAAGKAGAPEVIRAALTKSLPPVLLAALSDAGNAALGMLPRHLEMRTAKDKADKVPPVKLKMSFDASNPDAAKWAREHGAELAKDISDTTRDRIRDAVAREHETGESAEDALDSIFDDARAEMIARTESMDAANEGLAQGWDQAVEEGLLTGDEQKTWIAAEDPCPECEEVDGETVPMDEDFSVGDDPPLHPNCRCTMGLVS